LGNPSVADALKKIDEGVQIGFRQLRGRDGVAFGQPAVEVEFLFASQRRRRAKHGETAFESDGQLQAAGWDEAARKHQHNLGAENYQLQGRISCRVGRVSYFSVELLFALGNLFRTCRTE